jgi:hypothetical protein
MTQSIEVVNEPTKILSKYTINVILTTIRVVLIISENVCNIRILDVENYI